MLRQPFGRRFRDHGTKSTALGLSQMRRLAEFVERRHAIAADYDDRLAGLPVVTPWQHPDTHSGLHLYVIRLKRDRLRATHRQVFEALREGGVGVNLHYIPVYRQPYYQRLGFQTSSYPEAERYYAEAISLPMFATLGSEDLEHVVRVLAESVSLDGSGALS